MASSDLQTQPGGRSLKVRRLPLGLKSNSHDSLKLAHKTARTVCGEVAGRGGCGARLQKRVAAAPWVGSRLCVSPSASRGGAGPLTELNVAYGASQVFLGHYLADNHQQVELAVEEAMRQAGRSGRRRVGGAAGQLRLRGFHHHGRHPAGPLSLSEVPRSGCSSPLPQEKGLSRKVPSPLRPLRPPSSWRGAPPPPPPSPGAGGGAESGVRAGGAAPLLYGDQARSGGGRGGGKDHPAHPHAVAASSPAAVGPGADVICSKSSHSRPGSWRDEVCGQWAGPGRQSKGWGNRRTRVAGCENAPTYIPQTAPHPTPFVLGDGMVFRMQNGDVDLVQAAHVRPLPGGL